MRKDRHRRAFAATARSLDYGFVIIVFCCVLIGGAFNHKPLIQIAIYGMIFGYCASMFVSNILWGTCPLRLANEMLLYRKTYYRKTYFWNRMEKLFGENAIPYVALVQSSALAILVDVVIVTVFFIGKHI